MREKLREYRASSGGDLVQQDGATLRAVGWPLTACILDPVLTLLSQSKYSVVSHFETQISKR